MSIVSQPEVVARRVKGKGFGVIERNSTEVLLANLTQDEAVQKAEAVKEQLTEGLSLHDAVQAVEEAQRIVTEAVEKVREVEVEQGATDRDMFVGVCRCGCGAEPSEEGSRFLPGHDGRLKGRLLKAWRAGDEGSAAEMRELGWGHFLVETKTQVRRAEQRADLLVALAEFGVDDNPALNNAELLRELNHQRAVARKDADRQARMIARQQKEAAKVPA